ncbi:hypothetical protein CC78DRAFT_513242 [Lojkania enalia]|uniref:Stress-response A/B barrel domain-containing protein n=1 Tax=Lojkania enalia TaxID=147567 RepID=A0A9P4KDD5_9PLEO|nr:hypothetical protein CC78DRAFT_513242 [Didymosphaeria enalia]
MLVARKALGLFILIAAFTTFITFMRSVPSPLNWLLVPEPEVVPYISHVVLFQFKKGTTPMAVKEITSKMLGLRKACIHPSTRAPYIQSITGGKDISIEDLQNGMTHAFILRFYSKEDRNYYVEFDPVHQKFKEAATAVVEKVQVVDFQEGIFY